MVKIFNELLTQDSKGYNATLNTSGDLQHNLDLVAEKILIDDLENNLPDLVAAVISEESSEPIILNEFKGKFIVYIDPIDGSSNLDLNSPTGTIFSIYKRISKVNTRLADTDLLQPGENQFMAGYALYGPKLILVIATHGTADEYIYNRNTNCFQQSEKSIDISKHKPLYYSVNESYVNKFHSLTNKNLKNIKGSNLSLRYSGTLVADFHRILKKGGIFMYPSLISNQTGKLRLMYECNPLSYIVTMANGKASNGFVNILSVTPQSIHSKSPFYIGSKELVDKFVKSNL